MNISHIVSGVSLVVFGIICTANAKPVDVDFVNSSKWTIEEMYLSPTKEDKWGEDQLGKKVIKPGDTQTLRE